MPSALRQSAHAPSDGGARWSWATYLGFSVLALVYAWWVTHGTWRLFAVENYGDIFDHLALSIARGRLDLPPAVIGAEAFVIDGHHYGYWGPFPALLRLPLAIFGSGPWVGHTARLSSWVAAMLTVVAVRGIVVELVATLVAQVRARWFLGALVAAIGLGSVIPFLLGRAYVYHEVILWAGATAHVSAWAGLRALRTRSFQALVIMLLAAGASALTRPTIGYGAMLGAGLVLAFELWRLSRGDRAPWQTKLVDRRVIVLVSLLALGGALPFSYNYVRFGTLMRMPYEKYLLVTPERLEITKGGRVFQPVNLRPNFRAYFTPDHLEVTKRFPYFFTSYYSPRPGQRLEYWEPHASITATMSGVVVLALIGFVGFVRRPRLLTVLSGTLATLVVICCFTSLSERYIHDFSVLLTLTSAMGAAMVASALPRAIAWLRAGIAVLFAVSILQFTAFALTFQRLKAPATPESDKLAFEELAARIDDRVARTYGRFAGIPLQPVTVTDWQNLPVPRTGLVVRRTSPPGLLWYDGQYWQVLEGQCDEMVNLEVEVTLPADDRPTAEPLLSVGRPGEATILMLRSDGSGAWSAACDLWGLVFRFGPGFKPLARTFKLTLTLDRINGLIRVKHGADLWLDVRLKPHRLAGLPLNVGENPFGGSYCAAHFSGKVVAVPTQR